MPSSTSSFFLTLTIFLASANQVLGHGTITGVTGANGVQAAGFGIIADTPRDGALPVPFEQDTSVIRDREIKSGKTGVCGRTKAGGNNDVQSQLTAASNAGLPTASSSGELTMTLHQVNQDGAGPYSCDVSTDGGNTFQPATVATNVPGFAGLSLAAATDFPLVMQVSPNTVCSGGPNGDACIARCRNQALAGPFGSCVAFSMGNSAASSNSTAAAASTAAESTAAESTAATSTSAASAAGTSVAVSDGDSSASASGDSVSASVSPGSSDASAQSGGKAGGILSKLFGGAKRELPSLNKRVLNSRIAGRMAGYWIDA